MAVPFIPFVGGVKCHLTYNWQNQRVMNTIWFLNVAAAIPTSTQRSNLATALHTWWTTQMKTNIAVDVALAQIDVVDQATSSSPATTLVISPPEAGLSAGSTALNVSLALSLRTDFRGRNHRGRFYVAGLIQGNLLNPGTFSTAGVTALQGALAWLMTPANVANFTWVVASHFLNKVARSNATADPITAVAGDTLLDSQRRRLIGRGS